MDDNRSLVILPLPLSRHSEAQRFRMTLGSELHGSLENDVKSMIYRDSLQALVTIVTHSGEVIRIRVENQKIRGQDNKTHLIDNAQIRQRPM